MRRVCRTSLNLCNKHLSSINFPITERMRALEDQSFLIQWRLLTRMSNRKKFSFPDQLEPVSRGRKKSAEIKYELISLRWNVCKHSSSVGISLVASFVETDAKSSTDVLSMNIVCTCVSLSRRFRVIYSTGKEAARCLREYLEQPSSRARARLRHERQRKQQQHPRGCLLAFHGS